MIEVGIFQPPNDGTNQVADFGGVTPYLKLTAKQRVDPWKSMLGRWNLQLGPGVNPAWVSGRVQFLLIPFPPKRERSILKWGESLQLPDGFLGSNQLPVTSDQEIVQNPKSLQRIFWLRKRTKKKANGTRSHITFFGNMVLFQFIVSCLLFFLRKLLHHPFGNYVLPCFFCNASRQSKAWCSFGVSKQSTDLTRNGGRNSRFFLREKYDSYQVCYNVTYQTRMWKNEINGFCDV